MNNDPNPYRPSMDGKDNMTKRKIKRAPVLSKTPDEMSQDKYQSSQASRTPNNNYISQNTS
jgi:hypothetical protein